MLAVLKLTLLPHESRSGSINPDIRAIQENVQRQRIEHHVHSNHYPEMEGRLLQFHTIMNRIVSTLSPPRADNAFGTYVARVQVEKDERNAIVPRSGNAHIICEFPKQNQREYAAHNNVLDKR